MKLLSPLILASPKIYILPTLPNRAVSNALLTQTQRHSWRTPAPAGSPEVADLRGTFPRTQKDCSGSYSTSGHSGHSRIDWHVRKDDHIELESVAMVRIPFTSRRYAPYVRELLKSLWSLDQDPLWLLVDQLVTTGKPHNVPGTCPEFPQWKHVVEAPTFAAVVSTLVAQGNLLEPQFEEDGDEDPVDGTGVNPVPTWLVMYILATKVDSRVGAHEGLAFCLSQLDNTPTHFRASLLLLSMCSLSGHGLAAHALVILESFHDVFTRKESSLVESSGAIATQQESYLGSQETIIYQYNVLLTLLSKFTYIPGVPMRVGRLLRHMETCGVPLEDATANQIIGSRLASQFLIRTIREILEKQEGAQSRAKQEGMLSISLTKYFSKRRNQKEAMRYLDTARRINPLQHAKTYILSFRDVAASLSYLGKIEDERERESEKTDGSTPLEAEHSDKINGKGGFASALMNRRNRTVMSSPKQPALAPPMRHIYTSMLFTAALNNAISTSTFRALYTSIRAAHGADKVLETVALTGMLKRHAWDEAKDLWGQWQMESQSLRVKHLETQNYFERRNELFGDAEEAREAVGWTRFKEYLLHRSIYRMEVDATALAVAVRVLAGPGTVDLLEAFEVMDGFAIKAERGTLPSSADFNRSDARPSQPLFPRKVHPPDRYRPHNVRLTSRVINTFMARAFHLRRPDVVFRMWDGMTAYYGVDTSLSTLDILFRSARIAAAMENSLGWFIPRWLQKGTSWDFIRDKVSFHDLSEEIRWMLSPNCRPGLRWDGTPAWRVVRRLFREDILFANWPWLRDLEAPAKPVRGDEATSRIDALKELVMGDGPDLSHRLWGTQLGRMGKYPHLVPSMRSFREYVLMLGRVQRSSEIPQVLTWMKALEVRPSRRMLSMCLALWAEVGLGSPADDMWVESAPRRGDGQNGYAIEGQVMHGGEYGKLITWLEEWLGKDEVPNDAEALDSLRYIRKLEKSESILQ